MSFTVPSPRPAGSSHSSTLTQCVPSLPSGPTRRPSLSMSPTSGSSRTAPVPVPQRHGSLYGRSHRAGTSPGHTRVSGSVESNHLGSSPDHVSRGSIPAFDFLGSSFARRPTDKQEDVLNGDDVFEEDDGWLDLTAKDILCGASGEAVRMVPGEMVAEEAVEVLIKGGHECLLVAKPTNPVTYGFFDYADLNTFLLLVLQASSSADASVDDVPDRSAEVVELLRREVKVTVGAVCDISEKDPYHTLHDNTPVRTFLALFASGLHRVAVTSGGAPRILTASTMLEHFVSLGPDLVPSCFSLPVISQSLSLPLHPLISLPGTASVLDAMQVMSIQGLSGLGVLSGFGNVRESSSGSSAAQIMSSPSLMPIFSPSLDGGTPSLELAGGSGELVSIVTARDCAILVVPSEGKQVLSMGLGEVVKGIQVVEHAGQNRGEERMPVHTIGSDTTLLHACHLILATSASRVFLRTSVGTSPPLSPTPSLTMSGSSPSSSPSLSALSLSDGRLVNRATSALPAPPPTQLSPHYVVSILDILSCLAKAYRAKLSPPTLASDRDPVRLSNDKSLLGLSRWDLDPEGIGKRRRASSAASDEVTIETWRSARR